MAVAKIRKSGRETLYRGEWVELRPIPFGSDEADIVCVNDDCDGMEVDYDEDDTRDVTLRTVVGVGRIAFAGDWIPARGPSYASGGEPAALRRDWCPVCRMGEIEVL